MDSSIEYFKMKIDDHLYKEMEIMIEMYEANLTDEEWREIREFILSHPQHELVKILRSGVESKGDRRKTEENCS